MSNLPIVTINNNHSFTTSLLVAEKFNKRHKNVLRDIKNIIKTCPDNLFRQLNFEPTLRNIPGPKNSMRQEKIYNLSKDGFLILAMGFKGEKAFLWKIAFINAFNQMEQLLNQTQTTEHHALIDGLFTKHSQWQETRDLYIHGFSTREISQLQGKTQRNVQRMLARIRTAGISCQQKTLTALAA